MNKGLLWDLCSVIQFSSLYSPSPWICWIWISVCTSQLSIFQPPQPHSLWLPPDSVKDDKENNKPSIYVISCNMMFSQWLWGRTAATRQPHACKAWLYRFDLWNTISPHIHYYYCTQLHFFPTLAAWIDCTIYLLCDRFWIGSIKPLSNLDASAATRLLLWRKQSVEMYISVLFNCPCKGHS